MATKNARRSRHPKRKKPIVVAFLVLTLSLTVAFVSAIAIFDWMFNRSIQKLQVDPAIRSQARALETALTSYFPPGTTLSHAVSLTNEDKPLFDLRVRLQGEFTADEILSHFKTVDQALDENLPDGWAGSNLGVTARVDSRVLTVSGADTLDAEQSLATLSAIPPWIDVVQIDTKQRSITLRDSPPQDTQLEKNSHTCADQLRNLLSAESSFNQLPSEKSIHVEVHHCIHVPTEPNSTKSLPGPDFHIHSRPDSWAEQVASVAAFAMNVDQSQELLASSYSDGTLVVRLPVMGGSEPADPSPYTAIWPGKQVLIDHNNIRINSDGLPEQRK